MKLPGGWYWSDQERSEKLEAELRTEMIPEHVVYAKNIKVIADGDGATDDILCKHVDEEDLYTVVHLTWRMKPEINSSHPSIVVHGTFEDFLNHEAKWLE